MTMPELTIRPIRMSDKPLVEDFFATMSAESTGFFNENHINENRIMTFFDGTMKNHLVWLAVIEKDGGDYCVGILFFYDSHKKIPWLGIAVRDGYQGLHIGTQLMEYAKEYAEKTGCGGIALITAQNNYKGQHLYEKCGFNREGVHVTGEYMYLYYFDL